MEKDQRIIDVLDRLTADLGSDTFVVVDHWDADLVAVGIAPPRNLRRIAYISTLIERPHEFALELEEPGATPDPCDHTVVGSWDAIGYTELRMRVAAHLGSGATA